MGNYQQSDSLSTVTDLPFSGTGYGIVEARAADSDYTAWRWEVVLATVPGVSIPDRTEVTGQSWLTIGHDGQGGAGAHLIWTADWQYREDLAREVTPGLPESGRVHAGRCLG